LLENKAIFFHNLIAEVYIYIYIFTKTKYTNVMKKKIFASINVLLLSFLLGSATFSQDLPDDPNLEEGGSAYTCIQSEFHICRGCKASNSLNGYRQGSWPNCGFREG
jgi:hypothetical protein